FIPVLKAITHIESWVQSYRSGFESRTARLHLKERINEETRKRRERSHKGRHQSFAKEFGQGVRQQRMRGKTKERTGTLPLALSMFRKNTSAHGEVDLLKEVQGRHRDDRNSPKCTIGKVQIIKDGNNFCLSCLEEQRLVALLQGSVESDDSPASGGDEEEGEQAKADN
ncbi:unnamed protein product, partial [Porites evermanni]